MPVKRTINIDENRAMTFKGFSCDLSTGRVLGDGFVMNMQRSSVRVTDADSFTIMHVSCLSADENSIWFTKHCSINMVNKKLVR